ncbi:c-type cytochrome [Methylopila henanensis]|uniref:C-type cytochrome n=1 Tax=Methylopila henanensis TaxID=873516 RepID=A0ABW4K2R0_9HYPH
MKPHVVTAAAALALASFAAPSAAQDAAAGEKVFKRCVACHAVGEGAANKVGPELNGLIGRKVAGLDGYAYSAALKTYGEGKTWDEATLDQFLADPRGSAPGNKMAFAGLKKDDERKNVAAYLAQFDAGGAKK